MATIIIIMRPKTKIVLMIIAEIESNNVDIIKY